MILPLTNNLLLAVIIIRTFNKQLLIQFFKKDNNNNNNSQINKKTDSSGNFCQVIKLCLNHVFHIQMPRQKTNQSEKRISK